MLDESRLENNIRPAAEGSNVVKAIIGCDDQIVSTKCRIRETPKLQTNTSTKDFKLAPSMSRRARIRTRQWSCG